MRILDRYIFREVLSHTLLGLAVFTFVFFIPQLVRLMDLIVRHAGGAGRVTLLFLSSLPPILVFTLPMAALVGVDVDRTISITFVIAAALAAVAGTLYLMYYGVVSFSDGFVPGVKAFTAAVLGGIGSLPGAVIGGILIGLIETMWSAYFSIDYKDVAAFSVLVVTLIFLPQGLFGRPDVEKV